MKGIITWGLKQRRTMLIWWSIGVAAFMALEVSFYPSLRGQGQELNKSLGQLPDAVKSLIGSRDYTTPIGYLSGQIFFLLLPMLLTILAINLGGSLLAREEQQGTIELLLVRPISRSRLLLSKAMVGIVSLLLVSGMAGATLVLMAHLVKMDIGADKILLATGLAALFALSVGAVAFMLTAVGRLARGASIGVAALVGLGGYIVASLATNVHWLSSVAKFLPFYYYRPSEVLRGTYSWTSSLYMIGLIVGCGVVSWLAFRRRDISSS